MLNNVYVYTNDIYIYTMNIDINMDIDINDIGMT